VRQVEERPENREAPASRRGRVEMRTYGLGGQILADLGVGKMRVLGHAMKAPAMSGFGLEIVEYIEDPEAAAGHVKALR
jgi:3,4-dihydroxy 2-butanone 4-phosphate synthase/GTP cyclohydrolase II